MVFEKDHQFFHRRDPELHEQSTFHQDAWRKKHAQRPRHFGIPDLFHLPIQIQHIDRLVESVGEHGGFGAGASDQLDLHGLSFPS